VCALASAALPATAGAKLTVGISDDGTAMFTNQYFLRLNLPTARYITYWNVAVTRSHKALNATRTWINAAQRAGVTPLISFGGNGNYVPTVAQYTTAIKAFIHDFPTVKTFTAWNEPDWVYRSLTHKPGLAASYFNALVRNCHHCTVAAGDVYLPTPQLGSWLRAYKRGLRYRPAAWALHNYYDVRTHKTSQLRTMQSLTSGPIWLTEISGLERRGHWPYPSQSTAAAGRDESFLFSMPKHFPRVARIYHYQWQGTVDTKNTGWDSGLIGPGGVPRPAYWALATAAGLHHPTRK
jgi:hypothetical protein